MGVKFVSLRSLYRQAAQYWKWPVFICTDGVEKNMFPWGPVSPADGLIREAAPSADSQASEYFWEHC